MNNRPKYLGRANVTAQIRLDEAMQLRQARERREAEQAESAMNLIGRFVLFFVIIMFVGTAAIQLAIRYGFW